MKYIYTCYKCGFPMSLDEDNIPANCPACGGSKDQYLREPFNGSIEKRRIHVDPPAPDPNWPKYDISYHAPKQFPSGTRHGRVRRFVYYYDNAKTALEYYKSIFGWDIIPTEHADSMFPLYYCATGPGFPNWEPRFPSFGYGFLKAKETETTGKFPRFVVEVDSIVNILNQVESFEGKILRREYEVEGNKYAVLEDSEGNPFYIWQTPEYVTFQEPESANTCMWYRNIPRDMSPVPPADKTKYPYRAPKKFPDKDLHGRVRLGNIEYHDFKRFQRFWIELFNWDFFQLPSSITGGTSDTKPTCIIATGPSYEIWEGVVPGHMNFTCNYAVDDLKPVTYLMEIHMDRPVTTTTDTIKKYGGKIIGDTEHVREDWGENNTGKIYCIDPFGNRYSLWKCAASRTWDEAEAGWDWN